MTTAPRTAPTSSLREAMTWIEVLDCWDDCDGPAPHETTADGIIRTHRCLVCGHRWAHVAFGGEPHGDSR